MNDSFEREGRALAGPPAALLKSEEKSQPVPLTLLFSGSKQT